MNYLNYNLKILRSRTNLSLNEISQKIDGLSVSSLASYEDRVTPKIETILSLLDLYNEILETNITLDHLIRTDLDKPDAVKNEINHKNLFENLPEARNELEFMLVKSFLNLTEILKKTK